MAENKIDVYCTTCSKGLYHSHVVDPVSLSVANSRAEDHELFLVNYLEKEERIRQELQLTSSIWVLQ